MTATASAARPFAASLAAELDQLKRDRVYKRLNYLESPQAPACGWKGGARS